MRRGGRGGNGASSSERGAPHGALAAPPIRARHLVRARATAPTRVRRRPLAVHRFALQATRDSCARRVTPPRAPRVAALQAAHWPPRSRHLDGCAAAAVARGAVAAARGLKRGASRYTTKRLNKRRHLCSRAPATPPARARAQRAGSDTSPRGGGGRGDVSTRPAVPRAARAHVHAWHVPAGGHACSRDTPATCTGSRRGPRAIAAHAGSSPSRGAWRKCGGGANYNYPRVAQGATLVAHRRARAKAIAHSTHARVRAASRVYAPDSYLPNGRYRSVHTPAAAAPAARAHVIAQSAPKRTAQ